MKKDEKEIKEKRIIKIIPHLSQCDSKYLQLQRHFQKVWLIVLLRVSLFLAPFPEELKNIFFKHCKKHHNSSVDLDSL